MVLVRVAERPGRLDENAPDVLRLHRRELLDQFGKTGTAEVSHCQVDDVARPAHAIDRNDIGMLESRGRARLGGESLDKIGIVRLREREHLERHVASQILFLCPEHCGHATPTNHLPNVVDVTDSLSDDFQLGFLRRDLGGNGGHRRGCAVSKSALRAVLGVDGNLRAAPLAKHAESLPSWFDDMIPHNTAR